MKKRILVSFLLLLPFLCFAQQKLINDIEFFSGMSFFSGEGKNEKEETISVSSKKPSFTGGIGLVSYALSNDNSLGAFFSYESYYIKAFVYNFPGERLVFNQRNITKAENYQFGIKMQYLEKGQFKFPFILGISTIIIKASANPSAGVTWDMERIINSVFATAAAELHFNESIFFFARLQATFTVLALTDLVKYTEAPYNNIKKSYYVDKYKETEIGIYTTVTPVIGVGLKINGLFGK